MGARGRLLGMGGERLLLPGLRAETEAALIHRRGKAALGPNQP
jgi:hypothetical protein